VQSSEILHDELQVLVIIMRRLHCHSIQATWTEGFVLQSIITKHTISLRDLLCSLTYIVYSGW